MDGKLASFTVGFPGDLFGTVEGATKLDGNGSSWSGGTKSYHFPMAAGKKLAITLRSRTGMKEEVLPFKLEPTKK